MDKSNYLVNKYFDARFRGVAWTPPATNYIAIFIASAGQSPRSTAVSANQTTVPASPNGHAYRCTTAGTTGGSEPTWPTTAGATVTDGSAVWTEATPDFKSNTNLVEASGGSYGRASLASSTANWAATNGIGSTVSPSSGTSDQTSNNAAITFPNPTTPGWGLAIALGIYDASSGGNLYEFGMLTSPQSIPSGVTPVSFPDATLILTEA